MSESPELGRLFGTVADLYDEVRPDYPDELYDVLEATVGPVAGKDVLDLAAGTGLQTRALAGRGARVVAADPDLAMLRRLRTQVPEIPSVAAYGEQLPLRDAVADLVVCGTAWHWLLPGDAVSEIRRVLRPHGYLALSWVLNAWADGIEWEDRQSAIFERWDRVGGDQPAPRGIAPRDAAADLEARGIDVVLNQEFNWSREVTLEQHLRTLGTHSSNLVRPEDDRRAMLAEIEKALQPWLVVTERLWGPLIVARF